MILDPDRWDAARKRQRPYQEPSETLDELQTRLSSEHCDARHAGSSVRWELDLAGVYCVDCLDEDYHFNLMPYDGFLRVIDGSEPETDFQEISFLPDTE